MRIVSIYIKHDKKAAVRSVSWNILTKTTECNNLIGFSHRKCQKSDCPSVDIYRDIKKQWFKKLIRFQLVVILCKLYSKKIYLQKCRSIMVCTSWVIILVFTICCINFFIFYRYKWFAFIFSATWKILKSMVTTTLLSLRDRLKKRLV